MRHIGSLENETHAKSFYSYLVTRKIRCMVEAEGGEWAVWIYDEDQVESARNELSSFKESPTNPKYAEAVRAAAKLEKEQQKETKASQKRQVNVREQWQRPLIQRAPVTIALIAISLMVAAVLTDLNAPRRGGGGFVSIGPPLCTKPASKYLFVSEKNSSLPEVRSGEIWRLFTPMFLHFTILHIAFNMYWVREMGSAIETRIKSWRFLALVLFCEAMSIVLASQIEGPNAGGMSGVGYGLFGYLWVKGRFQPELGLGVSQNLTFMFMMWLGLGFSGMLGPISNWGHVFGMVGGGLFAFAPVWLRGLAGPAD